MEAAALNTQLISLPLSRSTAESRFSIDATTWEKIRQFCPEIELADTVEKKEACYHLRYRIFTEELGQNKDSKEARSQLSSDFLDTTGLIFGIFRKGRAVATCRINFSHYEAFPDEHLFGLNRLASEYGDKRICVASKLAIDSSERGSKIFSQFCQAIYAYVLFIGMRVFLAGCSKKLIPLYRHLGFAPYANPQEIPGFGEIWPLRINTEEPNSLPKKSLYYRVHKKLGMSDKVPRPGIPTIQRPYGVPIS